MTHKEMLTSFFRHRIPPSMFWLGPAEAADNTSGLSWNGEKWIVYDRKDGIFSNVLEFDTENEANDALYRRVTENFRK